MKLPLRLLALIIFVMILPTCHSSDGGSTTLKSNTSGKGANYAMKTYYMGRFALDVPLEMKQAVQAQSLRLAEVEDFVWPNNQPREDVRERIWQSRSSVIKGLKLPRTIKHHIIEEVPLFFDKRWAKAVLFYGNYIAADEGTWNLLVDTGTAGIWIRYSGLLKAKNEMQEWILTIAKAYQPLPADIRVNPSQTDRFYLKHGAINLPYKRQEKTYARFEGHTLDLKLEVDMNETHKVEKLGVAERLAASIATRFAPGVDVDTIRSRNRTAARLNGEELVMRMSASGEETQIQFGWEYRGEAESGERPEIQITMESADGNLNEKLKVWDAILDSFKPMYR
jgi:hypothetical protein